MDSRLLGMPLDEALERIAASGETPRVVYTRPTKRPDADEDGRKPFVVCVRADALVAAEFRVSAPRSKA